MEPLSKGKGKKLLAPFCACIGIIGTFAIPLAAGVGFFFNASQSGKIKIRIGSHIFSPRGIYLVSLHQQYPQV